jgi:hypothetical protein
MMARIRLALALACAVFAGVGALLLLVTSGPGAALINLGGFSFLGLLILPGGFVVSTGRD